MDGFVHPAFLALTIYRTITILQTALDYSRVASWKMHYGWYTLLKCYFLPYTKMTGVAPCQWCAGTWEICSYIGIIAFALLLVSFRKGIKWWHGIMVLLVLAGIGNDSYFYIMYWIQKIPTFSSHLCFSRIRVFTLCLPWYIAATSGLNELWLKYRDNKLKIFRYIVMVIGFLMAAEVMLVSHQIMRASHIKLAIDSVENTAGKFQNISALPEPYAYRAIKMNLGWLHGLGDSYLPDDTIRIGRDEKGYIGEFFQNGRSKKPTYWSPNKIVLRGLDPRQSLIVNMNPGRAWYGNGKSCFLDIGSLRCKSLF